MVTRRADLPQVADRRRFLRCVSCPAQSRLRMSTRNSAAYLHVGCVLHRRRSVFRCQCRCYSTRFGLKFAVRIYTTRSMDKQRSTGREGGLVVLYPRVISDTRCDGELSAMS